MKSFVGSFAALLCLVGCQQPTAPLHGDFVLARSNPNGIGVREAAVTNGDGPNGAHIIFLNFDGVTVKPPQGFADNSALNESQIANGTSTIPAFDATPYSGFTKATAEAAIVQQFKTYYAPFNVEVVTTRPSSGRYTMCVVGGDPSMLGIGQGAAGIAPLDCGNQNEPDVCYAFSAVLDPSNTGSANESLKAIATTCAQETAHTYGLGHTTNMNDVMYPQLTFTATGFAMGPQTLQNDGSGQCSNGSPTQDSYNMLLGVIGASSGMMMTGPTPTVAFVTPTDGSTVPLTFDIVVTAAEAGGTIAHVDIDAMGQSLGSFTTAPYKTTVTAPQNGQYTLTATAYDSNGNFQAASVTFTASSTAPPQMTGCQTAADCNTGLDCVNGQCVMPQPSQMCSDQNPCPSGQTCGSDGTCQSSNPQPMPGQTGATCSSNSDCNSGLCATLNGKSFCTATCDPSNNASCPSGFACVADSGSHYCEPSGNGDTGKTSGGCSTAPGAPEGFGGMLAALCLLAISLVARRRLARA